MYSQKALASSPPAGPATSSKNAAVMSIPAETPDEVQYLLPSLCTQRACETHSTVMGGLVCLAVNSCKNKLAAHGVK